MSPRLLLLWAALLPALTPFTAAAQPPGAAPHAGEQRRAAVVLLAHFRGELPDGAPVPAWAHDLLEPSHIGSVSHYWETMSFGAHRLRGTVAERRYSVSDGPAAYQSADLRENGDYGRFVREILEQADGHIDFSAFDDDGPDGVPNSGDDDGIVDAVFIVLASTPRGFLRGDATGIANLGLDGAVFQTNDAGSHAGDDDPVRILSSHGTVVRGRTFAEAAGHLAHEYGHLLGLPDLFDTAFLRQQDAQPEDDSAGIGNWGLMGWGADGWHGDDGPAGLSAWSRVQLGWARVTEVLHATKQIRLPDVGLAGDVVRVPLSARESFLLEYRTRDSTPYDRNLPADGLLIWHEEHLPPGAAARLVVDLETADGRWRDAGFPEGTVADPVNGGDNLDFWAHDAAYAAQHAGNLGDATDPFDGVRFTAFTPNSNPAAVSSSGKRSVRIEGIRVVDDTVVAQVQTAPLLVELQDVRVDDENGDGVVAQGEAARLVFGLRNRGGLAARSLRVVAHTADSLLQLADTVVVFRDLEIGRANFGGANLSPFPNLTFPDLTGSHVATVTLQVWANDELVDVRDVEVVGLAARPRLSGVHVVDDDGGDGDGRARAGELIALRLHLDFATPAAAKALTLRLESLDGLARQGIVEMGLAADAASTEWTATSARFVVPAGAGPALRFVLTGNNGFLVWRDTLAVAVSPGGDVVPPRMAAPAVERVPAGIRLSLVPAVIIDGSDIASVTGLAAVGGDTAAPARLPLTRRHDVWEGTWPEPPPGDHAIAAEAVDAAGNRGRSPWRALHVAAPGASTPGGDSDVLGRPAPWVVDTSPDGRWLAAGSGADVLLLESATLGEVVRLRGHTRRVAALRFGPRGRWLASASYDSTVRLWDSGTWTTHRQLRLHRGAVWGVAFSDDGQRLASIGADSTVHVWDLAGDSLRHAYRVGSATVMAFGGDPEILITGGNTARAWMGRRRIPVAEMNVAQSAADVALAPGGGLAAVASHAGPLDLWPVPVGEPRALRRTGRFNVGELAFSPDGATLAAGAWDGVELIDVATGATTVRFGAEGMSVASLAWSPDGQRLVMSAGFPERSLQVWDAAFGHLVAADEGFNADFLSVAVSPDGTRLAAGTRDERIFLWDLATRARVAVLHGHDRAQTYHPGVNAVLFDGRGTLISGGGDGSVRRWDLDTRAMTDSVHLGWEVTSLAVDARGRVIAGWLGGPPMLLWDPRVGRRELPGGRTFRTRLSLDPAGQRLAVIAQRGVDVVPVEGQPTMRLSTDGQIADVAWSADGGLAAAGAWEDSSLWWFDTRLELRAVHRSRRSYEAVAFSPDGRRIAAGDRDGAIVLWDPRSGETQILQGHSQSVAALAFTPSSDMLVSASHDGTLRLWPLDAPTAVDNGPLPGRFALHPAHPNPFNPATAIRFETPSPGPVLLRVYNALGQRVADLVDESLPAGAHRVVWDGRDEDGRAAATGLYLVRLQARDRAAARKLVLLR